LKFQMAEIEKRIWLLSTVVFAGAFAVRLYLALFSNIITPDGLMYIKTARLIESGESKRLTEFTFVHLYPYLTLLANRKGLRNSPSFTFTLTSSFSPIRYSRTGRQRDV